MPRERKFTVGREKTCDIPIADDSVSRLHAELTLLDGGQLFLIDCNSSNGTFVIRKGRPTRVRQEFITPADEIRFGETTFSVEDLLGVLRKKHQIPRSAELSQSHDEPPSTDSSHLKGNRLVRCECGAIRVKGERCRACGK